MSGGLMLIVANLLELISFAFMPIVERGLIPDFIIRFVTRMLLRGRLRSLPSESAARHDYINKFVANLKTRAIADVPEKANEQHYEVPADLYLLSLGKYLKYSAGYWPEGVNTLDASEKAALEQVCERAELVDGLDILDLGCGWGSLGMYVAAKYPKSRVTCMSNSTSQRGFIEARCKERGIKNLTVITADMNVFAPPKEAFDRVLTIECFEHMKNYQRLLKMVSSALKPKIGKLFVHIFVHKDTPYHFGEDGDDGWMSREFFSGGTMPHDHMLMRFQDDLSIEQHWANNGNHYAKTSEAWLSKFRANKNKGVMDVLGKTYGKENAGVWYVKWSLFFIACAEMFKFNDGNEWYVGHYLFVKK